MTVMLSAEANNIFYQLVIFSYAMRCVHILACSQSIQKSQRAPFLTVTQNDTKWFYSYSVVSSV